MTERWQRVRAVFERAVELDSDAREPFLREACGGDAELEAEVRRMLAADAPGDSFLDLGARAALATAAEFDAEPPEARHTEDSAATGPPGESIAPYRLLEKLGEGGMGEVWLAEQRQPVERRVALKIIKPGMDSAMVIARFAAERQALARMDHPAIARVYDAGTTAEGRPYFVMEYIRGVPITEHCDRERLTTRERLDLVLEVCEGVQHAHQRGIIHRDLKPSNVLVAQEGARSAPKIIDFGVAKATEGRLIDETLHTVVGVMIGTPEYMSPEQADLTAQDVDVRTDVYALGVLLYELLTGSLPFDSKKLRTQSFGEIRRRIRELDPPTPSTRFATIEGDLSTETARARRTDPAHLRRELKGDLDWIVMRALEKERSRRYGSPAELAAEIRRYLAHEPVEAGPPSARYRAGKFVRRHRIAVGFTAVLTMSLVAFAATMAFQARRIASERDRARQLASDLEQVAAFQAEQLSGIDPAAMGERLRQSILAEHRAALVRAHGTSEPGRDGPPAAFERALAPINFTNVSLATLEEGIFDRALETIESKFAGQPMVRARLLQSVADTLRELGLYERADGPQLEALRLRTASLGTDHPLTLESTMSLGRLRNDQARFEDSRSLYREVVDVRTRELGADHPDTLRAHLEMAVSAVLALGSDLAASEGIAREALERAERALGREHRVAIEARAHLGGLLGTLSKFPEAIAHSREAAELSRRVLGPEDPTTWALSWNLAGLLWRGGVLDEAEVRLRESTVLARSLYGDDHSRTIAAISTLAVLLETAGRFEESEPLTVSAFDTARRVLGPDHALTLVIQHNLGFLQYRMGRLTEAEATLREVLERRLRAHGEEHAIGTRGNLSLVLTAQGQAEEAAALAREDLKLAQQTLAPEHWMIGNCRGQLGLALTALGRFAEAEVELVKAHGELNAALGPEHERSRRVAGYLVELYEAREKAEPGKGHRPQSAP